MRTTRQYSITLPLQMAEFIDARLANGQYATESEVIREGLRALKAKDDAYEAWLRESATHFKNWLADPRIGQSIGEYNREKDEQDRLANLQTEAAALHSSNQIHHSVVVKPKTVVVKSKKVAKP